MTIGNGNITGIAVLPGATGQSSGRSMTINVSFKVATSRWDVGPLDVLEIFPVGSPIHMYMDPSTLNKVFEEIGTKTATAPFYRFPDAQTNCSDDVERDWEFIKNYPPSYATNMVLSSASIQGRDAGGKNKVLWIVNVTYLDNSRDQGHLSSPVITPLFGQVQKTVESAVFEGWFNRSSLQDNTKKCQMRPGSWQGYCLSDYEGPLPKLEGSGAKKPAVPINSAGDTIKKPLKYGHAKESYEVEWFSYTMLNMHCAIGKVNQNEYTLKAYDRPPSLKEATLASAIVEQPVGIFCRKFAPGELLVEDVRCSPMNWSGRNCYKYTVKLTADPDFHKAYILDSGTNTRAKVGDKTATGEEITEDDLQGTTQQTQPAAGVMGKSKEVLLDGEGKPLSDGETVLDPTQAIYLRWSFRQTIEFPPSNEVTSQNQFHLWNPNSQFQFLMDGGQRYKYTDQYEPWPDCDPSVVPVPETPACGKTSDAKQDNESRY